MVRDGQGPADRAVQSVKLRDRGKNLRILGKLDHPSEGKTCSDIHFNRTSPADSSLRGEGQTWAD